MRFIRLYIQSYSGLTRPAWMLAFVILINRSGAMVLPFLSLYLKDELAFDAGSVAFILMMFGAGSLTGSYIGGVLSDRWGTFNVQLWSLILTGIGFFVLSHLTTLTQLAAGFFIITTLSDAIRPANAASVAKYVEPKNLTQAYSLNRMAINLGFAVGPALGGILASISYTFLFYINGIACLLAAALFISYFYPKRKLKKHSQIHENQIPAKKSPLRDLQFMVFAVLVVLFGTVFFQFLFTWPIYYREHYFLSERSIGSLLALNGIIVFVLEMPMVYFLGRKFSIQKTVFTGSLLLAFTFLILNLGHSMVLLIFSMLLLSLSEIFIMPFLTTYSANRGGQNARGAYLGMYSMAYALSFIIAPALGIYIANLKGYGMLWWVLSALAIVITIGFVYIMKPQPVKVQNSTSY